MGREIILPMCHNEFLYCRCITMIVCMHNILLPSPMDGSPLSAGFSPCCFSDSSIVTISNECYDRHRLFCHVYNHYLFRKVYICRWLGCKLSLHTSSIEYIWVEGNIQNDKDCVFLTTMLLRWAGILFSGYVRQWIIYGTPYLTRIILPQLIATCVWSKRT